MSGSGDERHDRRTSGDMDRQALRVMKSAAAFHSKRVARRLGLRADDRADVEQDILLAMLRRRRFFDPTRGAWSTFVSAISDSIVREVVASINAARRRQTLLFELDANGGDAAGEAGIDGKPDRNGEGLAAPSPEDMIVLALSLERFMTTLPASHQLVAGLAIAEEGEMGEAQRRSGLSISEFYRRLHEIRIRLRCVDLVRVARPGADVSAERRNAA